MILELIVMRQVVTVAQDRLQWQALENTVMNPRVP